MELDVPIEGALQRIALRGDQKVPEVAVRRLAKEFVGLAIIEGFDRVERLGELIPSSRC